MRAASCWEPRNEAQHRLVTLVAVGVVNRSSVCPSVPSESRPLPNLWNVESVRKKKRGAAVGRICRREVLRAIKPGMKEWRGDRQWDWWVTVSRWNLSWSRLGWGHAHTRGYNVLNSAQGSFTPYAQTYAYLREHSQKRASAVYCNRTILENDATVHHIGYAWTRGSETAFFFIYFSFKHRRERAEATYVPVKSVQ